MEVTFAPKDIIQIDDCRITYKNFSGTPSQYNREGDRNFALIIPDRQLADDLIHNGWNVHIKPPREDGDDPFMYLPVKVKFNDYGPKVYLVTGKRMNRLDEDSVSMLDHLSMKQIDMDIRPYDWGPIGPDQKYGRTAYLQSIRVVQDIDRFEEEYAEEEHPEEDCPF